MFCLFTFLLNVLFCVLSIHFLVESIVLCLNSLLSWLIVLFRVLSVYILVECIVLCLNSLFSCWMYCFVFWLFTFLLNVRMFKQFQNLLNVLFCVIFRLHSCWMYCFVFKQTKLSCWMYCFVFFLFTFLLNVLFCKQTVYFLVEYIVLCFVCLHSTVESIV